jgi:ATP-dependent helicase/nuclease subunit A
MRSQIGKFSIDDMVKIRLQSRNTSFFNALCSYKENKNDHLAFKINQFISRLNGWKEQSKNSRISDLLWDILMKTDYFYFAGMLPNGLIRQGNLRLLIERASQYEQNGNTSIVDFIQYLERVKSRGGGDFSTAKILGENDNVVRMMTIHKSKGLEFPIVFCCGLGRTFNLSDLNDPIITNKICRVAPTYVNIEKRTRKMTLPQYAAKIQIKKENIAEEMRILYVAFTRAIDRLILVGTIPKYENWVEKCRQSIIGEFAIKGKRSYLDWIGIVLNQNSHNQYAINRITLSDLYEDTSRAKKNHQNLIHNLMNLPVDEAMQKEFQRKYNWRYEYKTENNLPGKLSVTDIQNMSVDKVESIRFKTPSLKDIPTYMGKEVGFSAAEIGTIHHAVLQLMPLRDEMTLQLIKDAIGKMVDKKLLTEEEAKVVDASKILGFYLSGIGRRMISAEYIKREQPFIIKKSASQILSNSKSDQAGDVLIQGIIDCFFVEGEEIILVDYKTDSISNRVDWLASHYKKQIEIYKEALETLTGKPVKESYLYLISHGQSIKML